MKVLVGRGRVYRFWGGHRKAEEVKISVQSDDFWLCVLLSGCCVGNQEWTKHS